MFATAESNANRALRYFPNGEDIRFVGMCCARRAGGSVGRDWQLFTKRGRQRQRGKRRQDEAPDNDDEMALIAHFAVRFLDE